MQKLNKRKAKSLPDARRYDFYGRPVTGQVWASAHESHSQVWSKRSARTLVTNRFDDLEHMRARKPGPNTVRFAVRNGTVVRMP